MAGSGFHVMKEPTDDLVLNIILDHARKNPGEAKVLLTANTKDFDTPDVQNILQSAGINRFFADTG